MHKRYGKTVALAGLDLDVRRGELLARARSERRRQVDGDLARGSGCSSRTPGDVRLLGRSPLDVESRRHVGVMMQEVGLTPELRVRELIELTASYYPDPLTDRRRRSS